ncbi:Protein DCL, chloroplastic [Linum perenne]
MGSLSKPPMSLHSHSNPIRAFPSPVIMSQSLSYSKATTPPTVCCAMKTESEGSKVLRKPPLHTPPPPATPTVANEEEEEEDAASEEDKWMDWEDQILKCTGPLIGFVRMILHSGKYGIGEKLCPDHERIIVDKLLRYHPKCAEKIGCGIDYITVGHHSDFNTSRCLFIIRKDGEQVDFSYWKCIKGMVRENYPLHAEYFFLRHFPAKKID